MHTFEKGKTRIHHNGDFSGDAMLTGKDSHVYIPCADLLAFADYARERMAEAKTDRPAGMSEEEHAAPVTDGTTTMEAPESRVTVLVRGAFGEKEFKAEMDIPESMLRYEANKKVEP